MSPAAITAFASATAAALLLSACGGDTLSQADNEPKGDFPVKVVASKFPTSQRLAQTSDLILGVKNIGDEPLPELAFTIETDDGEGSGGADGSFNIRLEDPNLADPNRPVWILENKFPREVGSEPPKGPSATVRAQTNTFGFGSLEPGETTKLVWRVTPVQPGTYTLSYVASAGLDGNAKAVTKDGGEVKGEFVVTITNKPPKATVDTAGNVVTEGK